MNENTKRYRDNYEDERGGAYTYMALAEMEKNPRLAEVYRRMGDSELRHAQRWEDLLKESGQPIPEYKPPFRIRLSIQMAKWFGSSAIIQGLQAKEVQGTQDYIAQPDATPNMAGDERSHARLLAQISKPGRGGMEGSVLAQMEGRHRTGGNALRAAVLGANDGLVSNLSLVMGVAGAALDNRSILITGLAGMLAGAISMALGEWLSVQSSRELYSHQIAIEKEEIEQSPQEEAEELALIYEARGISPEQARQLADQIISQPEMAVETLSREELGIDPDELGGSAWEAALTSFFLFTAGAIVPVIAFTFMNGMTAVFTSILLSTLGLFVLGVVTALFTGRSLLYSGGRMVLFGLAAAGVTFGIGRLVGVGLGG